jgi:beta-mannosidase
LSGKKTVYLRPGESVLQRTLDLGKLIASHGRDHVYLRIALDLDDACVSEETVFLTPPRFLELPRAKIKTTLRQLSPTRLLLTLESRVFQHRVAIDLADHAHTTSDNYLELYPGEKKQIVIDCARPLAAAKARDILRVHSLADTYSHA